MGNFFQILLFITIWPRQTESQGCATISGPDPNKPCIFPFKFGDITYNNCTTIGNDPGDTKAWCSTKVDNSGNHIGGQGKYGFCEPKCQSNFLDLGSNQNPTASVIPNCTDSYNISSEWGTGQKGIISFV